MKKVGFVGWRGMVGSVLVQRMREDVLAMDKAFHLALEFALLGGAAASGDAVAAIGGFHAAEAGTLALNALELGGVAVVLLARTRER